MLWLDTAGQYHAQCTYQGVEVFGTGATPVEAFAACWEAWLLTQCVSYASRPGELSVSDVFKQGY